MRSGVSPDRSRLFDALGLRANQLTGRTALVTGAARGIGLHTARALANLGANVILADISPEGADVARTLREAGHVAIFVEADIADVAAVQNLVAAANAHFGGVDILINNASQLKLGRVLEQPAAVWNATYMTNVMGPVTLIQSLVPQMLDRGRGVVLSLISAEGMPFLGAYCASKIALRSMMLSLGKEIPPGAGVSVLSVMPGAVDTPLLQEMIQTFSRLLDLPEADVRASMSNNPGYHGLVPVEHAAAAVAWYCVNAARYHGQFVDGYLPMSQAGLIDVGGDQSEFGKPQSVPTAVPNPARELKQLIETNRGLEARIRERTRELEEANTKLQQASLTDPLTGLWNRRYVDIAIDAAVSAAARMPDASRGPVHVLMIDIDHFKQINDTHGHLCGDAVLKDMARLLTTHVQGANRIMRWGGEEFLIVSNAVDGGPIESLAETLREAVAEHRFAVDHASAIRCTCSLGFTSLPLAAGARHAPWTSLISMADLCMYAAKKAGRNRWSGIEVRTGAIEDLLSPPGDGKVATLFETGRLSVSGCDAEARQALLQTTLPQLGALRSLPQPAL